MKMHDSRAPRKEFPAPQVTDIAVRARQGARRRAHRTDVIPMDEVMNYLSDRLFALEVAA